MAFPLAAAALAPSIFKGLYGMFGMSEFGNKQRPEYKIPEGVNQAESLYGYLAGSPLAGQQEAQTNIQQSQANTLENLTQNVSSGASLLNAAPKIQAGTNTALTNLAVAGSEQRKAGQKTLADFLQGTKAQYEDKAWQLNKYDPYLADQKAKQEATQNLFGGVSELASGALNINEASKIDLLTKKVTEGMGLKDTPTTTPNGDINSSGMPVEGSSGIDIKSIMNKVTGTIKNLGIQAGLKSIAPANVDLYSVLNGDITAKSETSEQIMMKDAQGINIQDLIGDRTQNNGEMDLTNSKLYEQNVLPQPPINKPIGYEQAYSDWMKEQNYTPTKEAKNAIDFSGNMLNNNSIVDNSNQTELDKYISKNVSPFISPNKPTVETPIKQEAVKQEAVKQEAVKQTTPEKALTKDEIYNLVNGEPDIIIPKKEPLFKGKNSIHNVYDITSYATNPKHEYIVQNIYRNLKESEIDTPEAADIYIKEKAPTSPIKGKYVFDAAKKYGVEPDAILAIIEADSTFGVHGKAVRTKNAGNVGNTDDGSTKTFNSWEEGIKAVAAWLKRHKKI